MPDSPSITRWRALWIADIRLGNARCQALALADFLDLNHADTLFLVGNTIDARCVRAERHWPRPHNEVFERLLRKAREGTRVIFIPGGLDAFATQFDGMTFGDVDVASEYIHVTAGGRRVLVTHSDGAQHPPSLSHWDAFFGDNLYRLTRIPATLRKMTARWRAASAATPVSSRTVVRADAAAIADDDAAGYSLAALRARALGLHGVISGASHDARLETRGALLYGQPGSWTTGARLLAEDESGEIRIIDAPAHVSSGPLRARAGIHLPTLPSALQRGHIRHHP